MRHIDDWTHFEWGGLFAGLLSAGAYKRFYWPKVSHVYVVPLYFGAAVALNNAGRFLHYLSERRQEANRKYVYDYVRLHPEDFNEEKKKYKDMLLPWDPVRH